MRAPLPLLLVYSVTSFTSLLSGLHRGAVRSVVPASSKPEERTHAESLKGKEEEEATHFSLKSHNNLSKVLRFYDKWHRNATTYFVAWSKSSSESSQEFLCLDRDSKNKYQQEMLAEMICHQEGHPTFNHIFRVPSRVEEYDASHVKCHQKEDYTINCTRTPGRTTGNETRCDRLVLQCGDCYERVPLFKGAGYSFNSHLYPRLQPQQVCQWDFESFFGSSLNIEVNITDLSIDQEDNNDYCGHSFLDILVGESSASLQNVATVCSGNQNNIFRIYGKSMVRFRLVTGSAEFQSNLRGFKATIVVEEANHIGKVGRTVGIIFSVPVGTIFLCCLYGCLCNKVQERKRERRTRRRRRYPGMTRPQLQPGVGLHEQRTARLAAQLQGAGGGGGGGDCGRENIYMIDTSVARRGPCRPLPPFKFNADTPPSFNDNYENSNDDDLKLYETISLQSSHVNVGGGGGEKLFPQCLDRSQSQPLVGAGGDWCRARSVSEYSHAQVTPLYLSLECDHSGGGAEVDETRGAEECEKV